MRDSTATLEQSGPSLTLHQPHFYDEQETAPPTSKTLILAEFDLNARREASRKAKMEAVEREAARERKAAYEALDKIASDDILTLIRREQGNPRMYAGWSAIVPQCALFAWVVQCGVGGDSLSGVAVDVVTTCDVLDQATYRPTRRASSPTERRGPESRSGCSRASRERSTRKEGGAGHQSGA